MVKQIFLFVLLLIGLSSVAQLYKKPVYPKYYFGWPTDLKPDIVANLGELRTNHWHMGLDVRTNAQVNKRVLAAANGYISFVGIAPLSWGRWIIIQHPNGLSTLYGHLNSFRPDLEEFVTSHQYQTESWETRLDIPPGRFPVKKGDFISYSGTTGGSEGPHLHWEVIDTKSDKRLNPTLFGTPIADNIPPTISRLAIYDRDNSTYYQSPQFFRLTKPGGAYGVAGDTITTFFSKLSFAIQTYDTRNGSSNQDGVYAARTFFDDEEISAFYIDSISYDATRYMNAHIDYKMKYNGGAYVQHLSPLPGDHSMIYVTNKTGGLIQLYDTLAHEVKMVVSDANQNSSTLQFFIKRRADMEAAAQKYEWHPNRLNRIFKYDFEAYLPMFALYDKMNSGYSRSSSSEVNSVSAKHKLGEDYIPVQDEFEVRIKPDKLVATKNRVVIKRTAKKAEIKKAQWNGEWMTAQFRDFGTFEAFVDTEPPVINEPGSGEVINFNKASRISFTPRDNFGIGSFRAEVDGKWLRFTNDKGKTWVYNFDSKIEPGEHTLTVQVTDIAGNVTTRNWKFTRGITKSSLDNSLVPNAKYLNEGEKDIDDAPVKPAVKNINVPVAKPLASSRTTRPSNITAAEKKQPVKKETLSQKQTTKTGAKKENTTTTKKTPGKKETVQKKAVTAKKEATQKTITKKRK